MCTKWIGTHDGGELGRVVAFSVKRANGSSSGDDDGGGGGCSPPQWAMERGVQPKRSHPSEMNLVGLVRNKLSVLLEGRQVLGNQALTCSLAPAPAPDRGRSLSPLFSSSHLTSSRFIPSHSTPRLHSLSFSLFLLASCFLHPPQALVLDQPSAC